MSKSKILPDGSSKANSDLLDLIQQRSVDGLRAVKEMSKRPLSSAQKIAQIKRNHALAERLEKLETAE